MEFLLTAQKLCEDLNETRLKKVHLNACFMCCTWINWLRDL